MRKRTFSSWVVFFVKLGLLALIATVLSFTLFTLANLSDNVKRFSFYVKTADDEMAKKELIGLHYFYELSRKWKVQWLADKYLFRDAFFYEAADAYLISDWQKVQEDLKEKLDDPRAYPYGNARFKEKKARFQKKAVKIEEALGFVMKEVAADFEKALRNCLDMGVAYAQCFDRVWNYDLATNKKDAEEALKGVPPQIPYILGPPKKEGIPGLPPPVVPSEGTKENEEKPGAGGPRKRP
ncbi:MAG: hypothetical protein HY505_02500 [Candidatus Yanofskybacteria bacterium]|nr:hypothetical protein [Candidatus Yanofskybacteria bacterium]